MWCRRESRTPCQFRDRAYSLPIYDRALQGIFTAYIQFVNIGYIHYLYNIWYIHCLYAPILSGGPGLIHCLSRYACKHIHYLYGRVFTTYRDIFTTYKRLSE